MCWLRSKEHGQAREAGTPHANPPAFCLFLEGQGTQGSTGSPGTKGLMRGLEEPEGCSTETSSGQAQPTGRGQAPDLKGMPGVESPGGRAAPEQQGARRTL